MKSPIKLNVLPLYRCNQRCITCLFQNKREDKDTLDLVWLEEILNKLNIYFDITRIDIKGGEPSLLSDFYYTMLYNLLKIYSKKITTTTNFVNLNKGIINYNDIINVKYNFIGNENKLKVFNNIKAAVATNKIINIKTYDIYCKDEINIINQLNNLKIKSFEIVPYHQAVGSKIKFVDYKLFEETVKRFLKNANKMQFAFQNKLQLEGILNLDNYNTLNIYITPNNKIALQKFEKNVFYLEEYENFDEFYKNFKKMEIFHEDFCKKCTSKLICMANHFLNLEYDGISCSGAKNLIENYKK